MVFAAIFFLLLVGAYMILDEIISLLAVVVPFAILLSSGIGVIVALWSGTRSRFLKYVIAVGILLLVYAIGTPSGSVRSAVLFSGHPVKAITLRVRKANREELKLENWPENEKAALYHVTKNAPASKKESRSLDMWSVSRHMWLFYAAQHYDETADYLTCKELGVLQRAQEAKPFTVYRAYEDFTVHDVFVPKGTVVVLETMTEGRTGIVIYGKDSNGNPVRSEDILLSSELPKAAPGEVVGPWSWYLPLTTPHLRNENNSGVSITPQLYAELDPLWSSARHLSYYEIETLVHQINSVNRMK